jgi:putative addiction module component (TIGR02574 family)
MQDAFNKGARMILTREQIKTAALHLEPGDREALAEELLLSLQEADRQKIDAAWLAEARRRDTAYRSGTVAARPVEEVITRLQNKAR